jgi:uncharacterized coiled-coil DUF342 family protein
MRSVPMPDQNKTQPQPQSNENISSTAMISQQMENNGINNLEKLSALKKLFIELTNLINEIGSEKKMLRERVEDLEIECAEVSEDISYQEEEISGLSKIIDELLKQPQEGNSEQLKSDLNITKSDRNKAIEARDYNSDKLQSFKQQIEEIKDQLARKSELCNWFAAKRLEINNEIKQLADFLLPLGPATKRAKKRKKSLQNKSEITKVTSYPKPLIGSSNNNTDGKQEEKIESSLHTKAQV